MGCICQSWINYLLLTWFWDRFSLQYLACRDVTVPVIKCINYGTCSFAVCGLTIWSSLPTQLGSEDLSIISLQHQLKTELYIKKFYALPDMCLANHVFSSSFVSHPPPGVHAVQTGSIFESLISQGSNAFHVRWESNTVYSMFYLKSSGKRSLYTGSDWPKLRWCIKCHVFFPTHSELPQSLTVKLRVFGWSSRTSVNGDFLSTVSISDSAAL